jgi:cytochrome c oxidase cbb3-type subunit 3
MSTFWSIWISVITLGTVFGCWWLLYATRKGQTSDTETERTTGHSFDGIEELDNPLPKWWFYLFVASCVFALIYLALYPGLGNYKGLLGWTQHNQWQEEQQIADARYGELYARFGDTPVEELYQNKEAMQMGQRLFANNCSVCHGSAGRGNIGFPNLTTDAWQYGGDPESLIYTLKNGRNGAMPAMGTMPNMTPTQVDQVVNYVLAYSDRAQNSEAAAKGEQVFMQACAACHGQDGKGNQDIGAPNLTDNEWVFGSTYDWIRDTVVNGRQNMMPAQSGRLSEDQIQILAAYVYSLSR